MDIGSPKGFTAAHAYDVAYPLICDKCGTLVARSASARHIGLHAQVVTQDQLDEILKALHDSVRYDNA